MKVLLIGEYNPSEILSGPQKFAKRIFEYGCESEDDFIFLDYFRGKDKSIFKKIFGYQVLRLERNEVIKLGLFRCLIYFFKYRPDVIHIVTFELFTILSLFYKMFSNVKIIYTVHGIVTHENRNFKENYKYYYLLKDDMTERLLFSYSDQIVFVSDASRHLANNYYNFSNNQIINVIPNGIDNIFFESTKKPTGINHPLKIVLVGDLHRKEKGYYTLFTALKNIHFQLEVTIISQSDIANDLKELNSAKLRISSKMSTIDFAKFLSYNDIYISTSNFDSFPVALIEAMAVGLIPIVTVQTGSSYIITDKINGFLFNSHDYSKLAEIIREINENRDIINVISANIKRDVEEYSWENVFQRYKDVYTNLAN